MLKSTKAHHCQIEEAGSAALGARIEVSPGTVINNEFYIYPPSNSNEVDQDTDCQDESTKGSDYRGRASTTATGQTCQRWSSMTPHWHMFDDLPENYCRNPDGETGVWCYTIDPRKRWELCDVPRCSKCTTGKREVKESSWKGVALDCGATLSLSEKEQPVIVFSNVAGQFGACTFTIKAPKDLHVELSCNSATATANGLGADGFHGEGPVVIEFTRTKEQPQLSCRAGLEEYHMEEIMNEDFNIDDFDRACNNNKDPKTKERRKAILAMNVRKIHKMNKNCSSTQRAKVTCLSDMTDEELRTTHLGLGVPPSREEMERETRKTEQELLAPLRLQRNIQASVDLTTMGRVSPAKQQAQCGSCAAFAAVTTMESCMHKATGVLPTDLSEQHILDCAYRWHPQIEGCKGAWPLRYQQWMW